MYKLNEQELNIKVNEYYKGDLLKYYKVSIHDEYIGDVLLRVSGTNILIKHWNWCINEGHKYILNNISKNKEKIICDSYDYYCKCNSIIFIAKVNLLNSYFVNDISRIIKYIVFNDYFHLI